MGRGRAEVMKLFLLHNPPTFMRRSEQASHPCAVLLCTASALLGVLVEPGAMRKELRSLGIGYPDNSCLVLPVLWGSVQSVAAGKATESFCWSACKKKNTKHAHDSSFNFYLALACRDRLSVVQVLKALDVFLKCMEVRPPPQ